MAAINGVEKVILKEGSSTNKPTKGDIVTIEYTGNVRDPSAPEERGKQFDTSKGRGDFVTAIGVGKVIRGWDEGVVQMNLGEKALLRINSEWAYGSRGFYDLIPPNSDLIFEVELKSFKKGTA